MLNISKLKCWQAISGKSAISIDQSRLSIWSFSKLTALNSSVNVWNDGVVLWDDFFVEKSAVLFIRLESSGTENVKRSIRSSNSNFYKTIGWNSFEKISVKIILSKKFAFLLKLISFMYNQSSLRSTDGKYRFAACSWFQVRFTMCSVI